MYLVSELCPFDRVFISKHFCTLHISVSIWDIFMNFIVYAHGRRLCSNRFRHGSTTISYPQCSLTFMPECYLHRCCEQSFAIRAYAMSAVGIDVVSDHKGREHCKHRYREQSYEILQNRIRYHKIAECIARYKGMNGL